MIRNTLYGNLVRSVYALDGLDGQFLGQLCEPIPFVPSDADWPASGTLAVIPSAKVASLRAGIAEVEESILEVQEDAQEFWSDDDYIHACHGLLVELKAMKAELKAELAAA